MKGFVAGATSTPFHLILRFQQNDRRPDARRANTGLTLANASERNNANGRLSSCPKGAVQIRQCGVAVLGKGKGPFPTDCALPWRIWAALKPQNKMKRGTRPIGRSLLPLFVKNGHQVVALVRIPQKVRDVEALGAKPIVADALEEEAVRRSTDLEALALHYCE
jgi:hypothetical protein